MDCEIARANDPHYFQKRLVGLAQEAVERNLI